MATRTYMSIGEVLLALKTEFPDITISKIRFLEGEGLIEPERTASGYRKFFEDDVERLRQILKLQRDEYLPLKVIKERLARREAEGGEPEEPREREREPEDQREEHRDGGDLEVDQEALEDEAGVVARRQPLPVVRVEQVVHLRIA